MNNDNYYEIIQKYYKYFFNRIPDESGFKHYSDLFKSGELDEQKFIKICENSEEYKRIQEWKENKKKNKPYIFQGKFELFYKIRPANALDLHITKKGIYHDWIPFKLKNLIPENGIIFDIGANAGLLSLPFAKNYVPNGNVYSFEPNSKVRNHFLENIKLNNLKNIVVEPIVLQENSKIRKILFYNRTVYFESLENDTMHSLYSDFSNEENEYVESSTLDNYVSEKNIPNINLIKIHVMGADSRVLEGGKSTINEFQPIIIYQHGQRFEYETGIHDSERCFNFMKKNGFKQYPIFESDLGKEIFEFEPFNKSNVNILCLGSNHATDFFNNY